MKIQDHIPAPRYALTGALLVLGVTVTQALPPAESPYAIPQPPFYGQVRLRTEYDHKSTVDASSNKTLLSTGLRTRLGFVATPSEKVEVKVEFQDVRTMGTEPTTGLAYPAATTGNAKGVDLLQGYFAIEEGNFKTAFGRQKMQLGAGRFLSTLEWSPTSRAFDGWSFNYRMEPGNLTGLVYLVKDTLNTTVKDRLVLSGLYYNYKVNDALSADVYAFYDQSRLKTAPAGDTALNYDLAYLGERTNGKIGLFTYEEEFIWQAGELNDGKKDLNSAAFQLALRAGALVQDHKFNVGVDMMSGDPDKTDKTNSLYRANYYFGHMYYGWMDYFTTNPKHGVIDYRADADIGLVGDVGSRKATLKAQYHFFTPQNAPSGDDDPYGQELNSELHLALYPKSNIVLGASLFIPADGAYKLPGASPVKGAKSENGFFLYFMPTFNF